MQKSKRSIGSAPDLTCLGVGPHWEHDILTSLPTEVDDMEPETLHHHHHPETGADVLCYVAAYVRKDNGRRVWRYVVHTAQASYRLTEDEYERWMEHTERVEATPAEAQYIRHSRAGQLDRIADHQECSPYSVAIRAIRRLREEVRAGEADSARGPHEGTATDIARSAGRRVAA